MKSLRGPRLYLAMFAIPFLAPLPAGAEGRKPVRFPIAQFTLKNGMRVIVSEDHSAPVIGLALMYNVGSRNEARGRTGFAHLFEHMLFQGSAHAPKGDFDRRIEGAGGMLNGFTRPEGTTYIESFPSEKLPTVLWLEADRMRSLSVTAENLKNQQEVVKEEKRMRYDNQPYANASQRLNELAFSNFANQHSTIGSMADLDAATLADVQQFFKTYYAPNNATLVLVGDVDLKTARRLTEQLFGGIPRQPAPPKLDDSEPKQTREKREVAPDRLARVPALLMAWHGPSLGNPDTYAVDLLNEILFRGESSRAYQELVKGRQMALSISANLDSQRGPSLVTLQAIYRPNIKPEDLEAAINGLIDEIKQKPPSSDELQRVKTRFRASRYRGFSIFGLESVLGRAIQIADYAVFQGDPNLINTEIDRYMAVTPEQIQAAARKYFTPENRTVVQVKPISALPRPHVEGIRP